MSQKYPFLVSPSIRTSFSNHITNIKAKCAERNNIIKILANKSWKLSNTVLRNLYNSLISSIIDYSFFIIFSISENNLSNLQVIQNNTIRSIFHLSYDTPRSILNERRAALPLDEIPARLDHLNESFVKKSLNHHNPIITKLVKEYKRGFNSRFCERPTPLCACSAILDRYTDETNAVPLVQ